ncbi:SUKH-4 family immunity protein [Streptomyces rimosus]|uniref:SUKH-4 family immunity protein n=1 Tax=Streptomyces rimosus TaxID=1927 RepID=UPI001F30A7CF|nr:SUKH-4 family immunity protein [Streptomyces rimosus]
MLEQHWQTIQEWWDLPRRKRRVLQVTGPSGSGKTSLLKELGQRFPGSVLIDCRGLSADAVAERILEGCGADTSRSVGTRIPDRLARATGTRRLVILVNSQWSGERLSSSEPLRVGQTLAARVGMGPRNDVRVAVELDEERERSRIPYRSPYRVSLTQDVGSARGDDVLGDEDNAGFRLALRALAVSELRVVPIPVWRVIGRALSGSDEGVGSPESGGTEHNLPDADFTALARRYPDVVTIRDGEDAIPTASFITDAAVYAWRSALGTGAVEHAAVTRALLTASQRDFPDSEWSQAGPVGHYAYRALATHAALAGELPRLLDTPVALANCEPSSLWEAMALAYPDGVPPNSVAALLHYLEEQGFTPGTQGEWVSWLHHAAVSDERLDLAAGLANSGIPMPWQTLWSRWRPPGKFGLLAGEAGAVQKLGLVPGMSGPVLIGARELKRGRDGALRPAHLIQTWEAETGTLIDRAHRVDGSLNEAAWERYRPQDDVPAVFAKHDRSGWHQENSAPGAGAVRTRPPQCPVAVTRGVGYQDTWLLGGDGGVFAVRVGDAVPRTVTQGEDRAGEQSAGVLHWSTPLLAAHNEPAIAAAPQHVVSAANGSVSADWLEETFGSAACRRLPEDQLPAGVTDEGARSFLSQVGFPYLQGFLHLGTEDLHHGGLRAVGRPDNAGNQDENDGPFYRLGVWMYSGLLLDGRTGQVLRDATGGHRDTLAGSSLHQFVVMVRLFDEYRRTMFPCSADQRDAKRTLRSWCQVVDPVAAAGETWADVLDDVDIDFEDDTWE